MKKTIYAFITALLLSGTSGLVYANKDHYGRTPEERTKALDKKVEKFTKELKLSNDQQASVRSALQAKMEKTEAAQAEAHQQIKSVLNAEQTKKFEEWKEDKN